MIETVADEGRIAGLATSVGKMALRDADSRIADEVEKIINKR